MPSGASPAQHFVIELLTDIFQNCIPKDGHALLSIRQAPMNVSQVCRHWRDIALHSRSLWSAVHLILDGDSQISENPTSILPLWISRTHSQPLSIHVECRQHGTESGNPDASPAEISTVSWDSVEATLLELAKASERIKSLHLTIPSTCCPDVFNLIDDEFPALEHFSLHLFKGAGVDKWPFISHVFEKIRPKLTSFDLTLSTRAAFYFYKIKTCKLLTKMSLTLTTDVASLLKIIDRCPALEELRIKPNDSEMSFAGRRRTHPYHVKWVQEFPSLRVFEVINSGGFDDIVGHVLNAIRCPQLRQFTLRFVDGGGESHLVEDALKGFLLASNAPLEDFNLIGDVLDEEYVISILSILPTIKAIRIRALDAVLRYLQLPEGNVAGIPCLFLEEIALDLEGPVSNQGRHPAIRDMIRSRLDPELCRTSEGLSLTRNDRSTSSPRRLREASLSGKRIRDWESFFS